MSSNDSRSDSATTPDRRVPRALDVWLHGDDDDWRLLGQGFTPLGRAEVLELAVRLAQPVPGAIVEFGVFEGASTRVLRDELWRRIWWDPATARRRIHAFDSFEGLPEGYEALPAGTFATRVPRLVGVDVVVGRFEDSLDDEVARRVGPVALAHFDADLESSTQTALDWLTPLLGPGSILCFDEFIGDDPAEARALARWMESTGTPVGLVALFARPPSGRVGRSDRRAIFQVLGERALRPHRPDPITRLRRRLLAAR
jgi:hypothetical protein